MAEPVPCTPQLAKAIDDRIADLLGRPRESDGKFHECETCTLKPDVSDLLWQIEDLEVRACGRCRDEAACAHCGEDDADKLRPDIERRRWLCLACVSYLNYQDQ